VSAAEQLRPDVVVLDISMPKMNGLDAANAMAKKGLPSEVPIFTMEARQREGGDGVPGLSQFRALCLA
jgi:chemotaxis response regulator CheB